MKPMLITGCQRSGTAYISAVICATGHWCSHERFYNEFVHHRLHSDSIESSHAAVPFLKATPAGTVVVHQVRHPLSVIGSLLHNGKFVGKSKARSALWAQQVAPQIANPKDDGAVATMRYWFEWNALVEDHSTTFWRVENLSPDHLEMALLASGRELAPGRAARALSLIPTDINGTPNRAEIDWDDLPSCKLRKMIQEKAREYGYSW